MRKIGVLGVPSSAGARLAGQETAPSALRKASLLHDLELAGLAIEDFGDLPEVTYRPDGENPKAQNLDLVVDVAKQVSARIRSIAGEQYLPLVLGGDCTVSIGVVAGLVRATSDLGLMYVDGDVDLNTPDTTETGILDGMVLAHLLGWGAKELAQIGPRSPLMPEHRICLFGYNMRAGGIDPVEVDALASLDLMKYEAAALTGAAEASAREALVRMEERVSAFLLHFDVDVMRRDDFPAVDVTHEHGLGLDETMAALRVFAASSKLAGIVVTEFNAAMDPGGAIARRLAKGLVKAMAPN